MNIKNFSDNLLAEFYFILDYFLKKRPKDRACCKLLDKVLGEITHRYNCSFKSSFSCGIRVKVKVGSILSLIENKDLRREILDRFEDKYRLCVDFLTVKRYLVGLIMKDREKIKKRENWNKKIICIEKEKDLALLKKIH